MNKICKTPGSDLAAWLVESYLTYQDRSVKPNVYCMYTHIKVESTCLCGYDASWWNSELGRMIMSHQACRHTELVLHGHITTWRYMMMSKNTENRIWWWESQGVVETTTLMTINISDVLYMIRNSLALTNINWQTLLMMIYTMCKHGKIVHRIW